METPSSFFKKAFFLGLLQLSLLMLLYLVIPPEANTYVAASIDKMALLEKIASPRLILVGGSNIAFGIDSTAMEHKLGRPVINTGLHAGLGLATMLNSVLPYVRPGDVVVLIPEYENFQDQEVVNGNVDLLASLIENDPAFLLYLAPARYLDIPHMLNLTLQKKISRVFTFSHEKIDYYSRDSFDAHGDYIAHLGHVSADPSLISSSGALSGSQIDLGTVELIETFSQQVKARGGLIFFDYPSLRQTNCDNSDSQAFINLDTLLHKNLTFPILSTPAERCFPSAYFFDTLYHLASQGRAVRTQRLLQALAPLLNK